VVTSVPLLNIKGKSKEKISLPKVFDTIYRPDVIRRAFLAVTSTRYQPKGVDPLAGKKTTAVSWGTGFGMSRAPRVKGSRSHSAQRGAFAPFAVGGFRAHPPRSQKKIVERINKKERRLGISSAIGATSNSDLVKSRGHQFPDDLQLPLVVEDAFQDVSTTSEIKAILQSLKIWSDVERVKNGLKIRAGKGKMRGRKYRHPVGPLIVIGERSGVSLGARNLLGVSIVSVDELNARDLAPGGVAGRLTVYTKSAIESLNKKEKGKK
jgi:large subunit ribosomal protein L4e